jgi:3-deoxy-7-phosphoheptulonate synthase
VDNVQTPQTWTLTSWRKKQAEQQPVYPDSEKLKGVLDQIRTYPPLVFAGEVNALKGRIAAAANGRAFLLQGGDCAERFRDCNEPTITRKLKILLQPRTAPTEMIANEVMHVYRGDNINSFEPTVAGRVPDPERLLHGYHLSSLTLNYIRALTTGGFADLHYPENWNLEFVGRSPQRARYEEIVGNIQDAIRFMESLGSHEKSLGTVDFYTSHEGLLLGYEEAMTRYVPELGRYYNLGAHMLWIGERTRQLDGAHVEYFRGVANPIGLKVGPEADPKDVVDVIKAINPTLEKGRVSLIPRFGHEHVAEKLPPLISAIKKAGLPVLWSSDPMHGNALKTKDNVKTRDFNSILGEVRSSFEIHRKHGTYLGGIHFELTGENVTECIGGSDRVALEDLDKSYETYCDPRLNNSQSLEMAFLISSMLKDHVGEGP